MKKFNEIFTRLMTLLSKLSALLLLVMAALVCIHVIMRGFFNSGLKGIYELVQYFMLAIVSFSLAENELTAGSITTSFLLDKMKPRVANVINIVMYSLTVCVMGYVFYNQTRMVAQKLRNGACSDVLGIPHWILIIIICIGLFFYMIAYIMKVYSLISNHKNLTEKKITNDEKAANMVAASEI